MKITPIATQLLESEGIKMDALVPVRSKSPITWGALLEFIDSKFSHQNPALLIDIESIRTAGKSLIPLFTLLGNGMAGMLEKGLVEGLHHEHV